MNKNLRSTRISFYTIALLGVTMTGVFALVADEVILPEKAINNRVITDLLSRIEAETYTAMQGVDLETTDDATGGQDVKNIDTGDWMDYTVQVPHDGVYSFRFRVANGYGDGSAFELRLANGTVVSQVSVPRTGGTQNWQTIGATARLNAGSQTLRIYVVKGDWNLNWFEAAEGRSLPGETGSGKFRRFNRRSP